MHIKKVKISSKGEVDIDYTKPAIHAKNKLDQQELDVVSVSSADAPLPEFEATLQSLDKDVAELMDMDEEFAATMKVRSVTFSLNKDGEEELTISVSKPVKCSNSPVNFTLTCVPENKWTPSMRKTLEMVRSHAVDYLEGKRAQQSLPLGASSEEESSAGEEETAGEEQGHGRGRNKRRGLGVIEGGRPGRRNGKGGEGATAAA